MLPLPTFDKVSHPDSVTGRVERLVGDKDNAVDPFYKTPHLRHHNPYIAIFYNASATFTFTPGNQISFFWGTPDDFNTISFYSGGKLVGNLLGADFQKAYGFSEGNRPFPIGHEDMIRIHSGVPFDTVVLSNGSTCCFEFSLFRPY